MSSNDESIFSRSFNGNAPLVPGPRKSHCMVIKKYIVRVRTYLVRHHQQTYNTITQVLDAVAAEREQTTSTAPCPVMMDKNATL